MILYKYYSFDAGMRAIRSRKLGFRQPAYFNDPFELSYLSNSGGPTEKVGQLHEVLSKLRKQVAILSLTRNPENPLMWSHYGDNHTGFVIGYDVRGVFLSSEKYNIIPVDDGDVVYTNTKTKHVLDHEKMDQIHLAYLASVGDDRIIAASDRAMFRKIFLTKHSSWVYEEEVRIVKPTYSLFSSIEEFQSNPLYSYRESDGIDGLHIYDHSAKIRSVYFGVKNKINNPLINMPLIEELMEISSSIKDITFKKITMSETSWSLKSKSVDLSKTGLTSRSS